MEPAPHEDGEAALRPLRTIRSVVDSLRAGGLSPEEERGAVIQVASAVEMSLRRALRDHPGIAIEVRLRALATDELRPDEVLSELRQHDRISMQLAASVHDLLETRRKLKGGAPLSPGAGAHAAGVADRLEAEVGGGFVPPADQTLVAGELDDPASAESDVLAVPPRHRDRRYWAAGAVLFLALLIPLGIWMARDSGDQDMAQGIALFRSGAYADAASHFHRSAQANPDDVTPRLYLARVHRRLGRYDLAVPELRAALEIAPDDPAVHTELGLLLTDTGRFDVAVARFREAIRLDPEAEAAWIGLVRALRAAGRPEAAEAVMAQAPPAIRAMLARPAAATDTAPL